MQGTWVRSSFGKIPQLSPGATTTEACVPRACTLQQEKTPQLEACTLQWRAAHLPQLEKGCAQQQRSSAATNKSYYNSNNRKQRSRAGAAYLINRSTSGRARTWIKSHSWPLISLIHPNKSGNVSKNISNHVYSLVFISSNRFNDLDTSRVNRIIWCYSFMVNMFIYSCLILQSGINVS